MDPLVTSSLIGAGSNLLGGLFGGGDDGPTLWQQYNEKEQSSYRMAENLPEKQVLGFRKAGIHPLAGLGIPSGGSGGMAQVGGDSSGRNFADYAAEAGQGISRAVAAYASREEREMAIASSKLSLENMELQNARLASEVALMRQAGTPPGFSAMNPDAPDARYSLQKDRPIGYGDQAPILREAINPSGHKIRVWNEEDLGDNEMASILHGIMYTAPDMAKSAMRNLADKIHKLTRKHRWKSQSRWLKSATKGRY